jgi:hypothetical protein
MLLLLLVIFWAMQIFASVAFKYGSADGNRHSRRWLAGFVAGNIVGASSIYFAMRIYELFPTNPNLAAVLIGVGGFVGSQLVLAWLFRSKLTGVQWAGMCLYALGTVVASLGAK